MNKTFCDTCGKEITTYHNQTITEDRVYDFCSWECHKKFTIEKFGVQFVSKGQKHLSKEVKP